METDLETEFNEILKSDGVTEAVFSGEHGLCLIASPNIKPEMAGIVSAIAQHAAKIENTDENPTINFEGDTRQCIIKKGGPVTTAIFKKVT